MTGLVGSGLVLQNNLGDDLAIASNGHFTFDTPLQSGTPFVVTVLSQPTSPWQTCTIANYSGTIGASDVTGIAVACTTRTYAVGGTVNGLAGSGLVLQNNGGDDLGVAADGAFAFPTAVASGAGYHVTVKTQPSSPTQTCSVASAAGTISNAAISGIVVTCSTSAFAVGGTVTGLAGSGLVLEDNAGDDLAVTSDGAFAFSTPVASGSAYAVTVLTQPTSPAQTCTVANGTGTIGSADVSSVAVTCTTNTYLVGGTVTGLVGSGLILLNNGTDELSVTSNGSFHFALPIVTQGSYSVTIKAQPTSPMQTCTLTAASGTVGTAPVTTVAVGCTTNTYSVGGAVSGLAGSGLVLQNNGGNNLAISGNGSFTFTTRVASGSNYAVTVLTQPSSPAQTCTVTNGSGSIVSTNVATVAVNCVTNMYSVGGTVSGLVGSGLVLVNNLGNDLSITANGSFTFSLPLVSGSTYAVTVKTQPTSPTQTCSVASGSGTIASNVSNIAVRCSQVMYSIGGTVSGLSGSGLVLENNVLDTVTVGANGPFTFADQVAFGDTYSVVVRVQPSSGQTCSVANGSGTVSGQVTNVAVTCINGCSAGWGDCNADGVCEELITNENCGTCGNRCNSGYECSFGVCCPVGVACGSRGGDGERP